MDRYPANDDTQPELELWEPDEFERTSPATAGSTGHAIRGRIARSLPSAAAATFLVAAMAFGAATRSTPTAPAGGSDTGADKIGAVDGADGTGGTGGAEGGSSTGVDGEPTGGADGSPTDGPDKTTEPTDAPDAEPTVASLELALHLEDGYVKVDWSACDPDGFRYYKVVRSFDEKPTWPLGEGDKIVAAIEDPAKTVAADTDLPLGKKLFYRVFALALHGDALVVVCQSPVRGLLVPAATPKPEPTPKPEATEPPAASIELSLSIREGKPWVDWSACANDFQAYKVVRSTNSTVSWPKGEGDSLAAVVGPDGKTAILDGDAPAGKKVWYRVFCVRETDAGWKVLASSATKGISVPASEPDPEPDPIGLAFEAGQTDGGVGLHWGGCDSDVFVAYKVVRSAGPNPSYLPGTDGSQLIAVFENAGVTSFTDHDVAAGQTWYYRVQAIGWMNGHKILLGQTPAIAVTVE